MVKQNNGKTMVKFQLGLSPIEFQLVCFCDLNDKQI
jgi:hypothetical protein